MIRKHENSDSYKAGFYALAVHAALLVAMLVSFNWKAAHPVMNVTEVELWDKLPAPRVIETPKPEPVIKEEPKPEVKPEPKPIVKEEPKPEPKPEEPKVDIELEKKKKELELKKEKELEQKLIQKKKLEALQAETREEALKDKAAAEKAQKDALKKAQQEFLDEEKGNDDKASSATNASLVGEYTEKIKAKIRGNVNKTLCGDGNPEVTFAISVLPTGQLSSNPKLVKTSGNTACDEAAERAIIASEPLPLPSDPALFSQFRNINLKFRPND
jgi:colicin import membrane protein